MSRILLSLLFVISVVFAARAEPGPRRVAVVVGVGGYLNVPHLANPPRDATAVAAILRKLGFDTTLVIDPDRAGLEQAIRTLGDKSRAADAAVFFYAGHALESDGHNYIVPVSAKVNTSRDLPFETVDIDLVGQQVEGRARTVIVFLDACRDNPFAINLSGRERGVKPGRGLAAPAADGSGTLIAFATAPGRTAEDGDGADSPFTTALLRHLDTAGLEVRQMLGLVRHDVREATGGRQIPWESSALEGSFYFHPGNAAQAAPPDTDVADASSSPAAGSTRGAPSGDAASTNAIKAPASQPGAMPVVAPPVASRCRVGRIMGIRKPGGTETTMRIANDGRGCAFRVFVRVPDHVLFTSLVASTPPAHGRLVVNDNSQVIYWPKPGFTGEDHFVMDSVPHGSIRVRVLVRPAAADPA
jgi:uncharacterized caspase-like protein